MAKQPYMPFYTGDYIKDTRKLPLSVRGAWVDLLLFMWNEEVRGELIDTIEGFSGMLSCSEKECQFALNLLMQKKVCSYENLSDGRIKIISRRMKRDIKISTKRSESGKKGVFVKNLHKQNNKFGSAKHKQNPDIEYEVDNDNEIWKEGMGENLWNTYPNRENINLELPEIKLGSAIQIHHITNQSKITEQQALGLWSVFKEQNFTGKKYYGSDSEVYSHFINWIKIQKINGTYQRNIGQAPVAEIISERGFGNI